MKLVINMDAFPVLPRVQHKTQGTASLIPLGVRPLHWNTAPYSIPGSTDSEWIYALLLSQMPDPGGYSTSDEIRRAIDKTLSIIGAVREARGIFVASSANLIVSDGRQIFTVRFCFDLSAKSR